MSQSGGARRTQSSTIFSQRSRNEETQPSVEILRVNKRPRTENDSTAAPEVTITDVDQDLHRSASTNTVIEAPTNNNLNNYDVIKLDRLMDKYDRFESHKNFLNDCIRDKVIPKGLRIDIIPTIGNSNDEFV